LSGEDERNNALNTHRIIKIPLGSLTIVFFAVDKCPEMQTHPELHHVLPGLTMLV
jgi:hypothetical protein